MKRWLMVVYVFLASSHVCFILWKSSREQIDDLLFIFYVVSLVLLLKKVAKNKKKEHEDRIKGSKNV